MDRCPTATERFKQLQLVVDEIRVDAKIPIFRYFRSGVEMKRMADTYYDEQALESAYILYMKYATLFLEKIRIHPEYKKLSAVERAQVVESLKVVMPRLELVKKALTENFEKRFADWLAEDEARLALAKAQQDKQRLQDLQHAAQQYHQEKEQALAISRDHEQALWQQLQQDTAGDPASSSPSPPPPSAPGRPAIPDRSTKPVVALAPEISSQPSCSPKSSLRTVIVPTDLMATFLSLAESNTKANVETGGILSGKLSHNTFLVSHLLIPKQRGTADSFISLEDGDLELFQYQDSHHLITLGWVHTHPTQSAFLSSVDLHTQLSYQLLLPEALALVLAPKCDEQDFFVLTPDYGLGFIENCNETGFHPHPSQPPLFQRASHVNLDPSLKIHVVDFR